MVLELVRPWRFPIRELPFEQKEHQEQEQQQQQQQQQQRGKVAIKSSFSVGFRSYIREFFGAVLELVRPSEARCFPPRQVFFRSPPAGDFFEAVLRQQPQATEAVEKGCFSKISEETLGSFLAWFWNLFVHGAFQSGSCLLNRRSIKSRSCSSSRRKK